MSFPARRRDRPIESQVSPRAAWYDRNPIDKMVDFAGVIAAPHTTTQRWTYTVPAGKKAFVELLTVNLRRNEAATTLGTAMIVVRFKPSGLAEAVLSFASLQKNTVGDDFVQGFGQNVTMLAGDQVRSTTEDNSTGGTVGYGNTMKATEFDA